MEESGEEIMVQEPELDLTKDPRILYLKESTYELLKYSADKWSKLIANEEMLTKIKDFLQKPYPELLLFMKDISSQLIIVTEFPSHLERKMVYFIKLKPESIPKDNFRRSLIIGDISSNPLEQLNLFIDQVLTPIVSNPNNQQLWPESVCADVVNHVQDFKNVLCKTIGLSRASYADWNQFD